MEHKLAKIFVRQQDPIRMVLKKLTANKTDRDLPPGIALVVDGGEKLLGIVTNGDIRRAFAAGVGVRDPVVKAMNRSPSVIEKPPNRTEVLSLVFDKIRAGEWPKDRLEKIIIVDDRRRVLDLASFYDLVRSSDVRFKHIGVVGLGYVGLTLGLTLADVGFTVNGIDASPDVMRSIVKGKPHFFEAGLTQLLKDHLGARFRAVDSFRKENNCDVYFIAVGTPLGTGYKPDLKYLSSAVQSVGRVLKPGDAVILRSTVPIGTTRNVAAPILEKESGLKAGEGFLLAFAPERTAEGKALEELRVLPQVIGGLNRASSDLAANIFAFLTLSTVLVDSLEAAEMVKLVNNTYRDVTFGFANEVSLVAKHWGIDGKSVIDAANYGYQRSRIPAPSPGVGGYCLEKDPFIFIQSAKAKGYEPLLVPAARKISDRMVERVAADVSAFLKARVPAGKNPKILILGFAFKGEPLTSDVRGSTAIALVQRLRSLGRPLFFGFDPAVRKDDVARDRVNLVRDPQAGFKNADAVIVMNNNRAFAELDVRSLLAKSSRPVLFFDSWALYNREEIEKVKGAEYRRL